MNKTPKDMKYGTIHKTNCGPIIILKYYDHLNVMVKFTDTGYKTNTSSNLIRAGSIKDRLRPSVQGVGFIGVGKYKATENRKPSKAFDCWRGVLQRCFDKKFQKRVPSYAKCTVCSEWHNFQIFAKWFHENHPNDGARYEIDKDIKVKGNKHYSPETCLIVTQKENVAEAVVRCNSKTYKLKSPSGEVVTIRNMAKFCRENNLKDSNMILVFNGKRKSHHGWTKP